MKKDEKYDLVTVVFCIALHYIQIYNAPYMSIRKRIWSAVMAPERLHIAGLHNVFGLSSLLRRPP